MFNKKFKNVMTLVLAFIMLFANANLAFAEVSNQELNSVVEDMAIYMQREVKEPAYGVMSGEWAILGLARSEENVPSAYYNKYYSNLEEVVAAKKGVLDRTKHTEFSRVIVAVTAMGKDARDVAGYDLTTPLGDFKKTVVQGINGSVWALIALDSNDYPMPQNPKAKVQATRDMYVQEILDKQSADGGWAFGGGKADPDMTGMALQALAKYQDKPEVKAAIDRAVATLSSLQNDKGGFTSWGTENSESCVQVIVALTELGISLDDARFVKNGNTLLDNLLTFYDKGRVVKGELVENGFKHTHDNTGENQMASEQGFYGVVAAKRAREGKNTLYRMGDAVPVI